MRRDILIVVVFNGFVLLLIGFCNWLMHHRFTGLSSIPVAVVGIFVVIVCTVIAAALIRRLLIGVLGLLALWMVLIVWDVSSSSATLLDVAEPAGIFLVVQLIVMVVAWWGFRVFRRGGVR